MEEFEEVEELTTDMLRAGNRILIVNCSDEKYLLNNFSVIKEVAGVRLLLKSKKIICACFLSLVENILPLKRGQTISFFNIYGSDDIHLSIEKIGFKVKEDGSKA